MCQASDTKVEMVGPDVCCPAGEAGIAALPSQTRRGNSWWCEVQWFALNAGTSGLIRVWLGRRAGPKAEWDRAVGTAVLGRAAAETSAAIAEHRSLIGFVHHPGGISRYLDDRSNIRDQYGYQGSAWASDGVGDSGSYAALATYLGQVCAMLRRG